MFTGNTLQLAIFDKRFGLTVERGCAFSFVGKVPTRLERRVVPCARKDHIEEAVAENGIVGIIASEALANKVPRHLGLAVSSDPVKSAMMLQSHISGIEGFQWKSFESRIHPGAVIYPGSYISKRDVVIGEGTVVFPNSVILPRAVIGKNCTIGPGTIVSTDAFEVDMSVDPCSFVRQSGGVHIADDVGIQANCTIVRATFGGFTDIGAGSKLDCQVHFAHDCSAGRNVRIAACAEISGRVTIGDRVFIGPNASVSNGISIGEGAKVTIGSVVTRDVLAGETVTGNFAVKHSAWLEFVKSLK